MANALKTEVERVAGKVADFYVHYTRVTRAGKRKNFFDAMWAPDEETARRKTKAFAKELGWNIEITRVEPVAK
jgi:hypothetical protein